MLDIKLLQIFHSKSFKYKFSFKKQIKINDSSKIYSSLFKKHSLNVLWNIVWNLPLMGKICSLPLSWVPHIQHLDFCLCIEPLYTLHCTWVTIKILTVVIRQLTIFLLMGDKEKHLNLLRIICDACNLETTPITKYYLEVIRFCDQILAIYLEKKILTDNFFAICLNKKCSCNPILYVNS